MPEDGGGNGGDVVGGGAGAALQGGAGNGGEHQRLTGPGPGPPGDVVFDEIRGGRVIRARAAAEDRRIAQDVLGGWNAADEMLVGHDFHYDGPKRHYFDDLSDVPGEYPLKLRKWSEFDKRGRGDDLLAVYKRIADQKGRPEIFNCTPGSKLPWFPMRALDDFCA